MSILRWICVSLIIVICCSFFGHFDNKKPINNELQNDISESIDNNEQTEPEEKPEEPDVPEQPLLNDTTDQPEQPPAANEEPTLPENNQPQQPVEEPEPPQPTPEEIAATVKAKALDVIHSVVTADMTEYQKLRAVYEWLYHNFRYRTVWVDLTNGITDPMTYDLSSYYFKYHKGSCEHYAAVQKVLFEQMGYEVLYVYGERYSAPENAYGTHIWVMINLGGNWYHVDGLYSGNHTADITTAFLVPDTDIESHHTWTRENYPACVTPKYFG